MIADFRSDTLTKPGRAMLDAMMNAEVGDDVWEEDPTVKNLEDELAGKFGMANGLFCPSGTMANQIAIRIHTRPQDEVICDWFSHIHHYEAGGPAANSLVSLKLIHTKKGLLSKDQILENINPRDVHFPLSRLVVVENTCNKGGGYSYELDDLKEIKKVCLENGMKLHMDGARVYNAIVAKGYQPTDLGNELDSISICLSKGLGCPVGTVLLIKEDEKFDEAKRVRKAFGGGMRQAGYLAAAGIYALKNNVERLKEDHRKAKTLGEILMDTDYTDSVKDVETNIVLVRLKKHLKPSDFLKRTSQQGVLCTPMGPEWIRFVTHLDINDDIMDHSSSVLKSLSFS